MAARHADIEDKSSCRVEDDEKWQWMLEEGSPLPATSGAGAANASANGATNNNNGHHDHENSGDGQNDFDERLALLEQKLERALNGSGITRATSTATIGSGSAGDETDDGSSNKNISNDSFLNHHDDPKRPTLSAIEDDSSIDSIEAGKTLLPESTYSLIITEQFLTASYVMAIITACLIMTCLILALMQAFERGSRRNTLGLPVDVKPRVRLAQFIGIFVGVLMEDEIPQGLELIAMSISSGSFSLNNDESKILKRVLFSSTLRLIVGYMFLLSLFMTVVQTSDVLGVFFDVLALQFVESIDDVAYGLAKRGFFGSKMTRATRKSHWLQSNNGDTRRLSSSTWPNRFARAVYYLNAVGLLSGMIAVSLKQRNGVYRCKDLMVVFPEEMLERAYIVDPLDVGTANIINDPLIYPSFNGVYYQDGLYNGFPRYREGNKNDGSWFKQTIGAEIIYCTSINSWVFRHPHIMTSLVEEKENECSWLARSPETQEFDILEVAKEEWNIWTGRVGTTSISMNCNECWDIPDCSYQGYCGKDNKCVCRPGYFGELCQFEQPCPMLKSKVGYGCGVLALDGDEDQFRKIYNRPVYIKNNVALYPYASRSSPENTVAFILGRDPDSDEVDQFASGEGNLSIHSSFNDSMPTIAISNYSVVLTYAGSRWLGSIMLSEILATEKFSSEYHSFWSAAYKRDSTFLVSEITYDGSPGKSDFYQTRKGQERGTGAFVHGAYGILAPMMDLKGEGLFSCVNDTNCNSQYSAALPSVDFASDNFTDGLNVTSNEADESLFFNNGE